MFDEPLMRLEPQCVWNLVVTCFAGRKKEISKLIMQVAEEKHQAVAMRDEDEDVVPG